MTCGYRTKQEPAVAVHSQRQSVSHSQEPSLVDVTFKEWRIVLRNNLFHWYMDAFAVGHQYWLKKEDKKKVQKIKTGVASYPPPLFFFLGWGDRRCAPVRHVVRRDAQSSVATEGHVCRDT
uniref:Uncharacterized protein n=1 Tax=Trichuris muris TaxID=70415 RepID=A0A5S6QJ96_TRIMR